MKAKIFNADNAVGHTRTGGESAIYINPKTGVMTLRTGLVDAAKLTKGETIEFIQDEDRPKDWYVRRHKSGLALRQNADQKSLVVNSSLVAREILKSVGLKEVSTKMLVATEPIEDKELGKLYAIITKSAIQNTKE